MAETITTDNKSTLLYRFLVSPELRWARYLVLIMVLATISFNQVFIIFLDYRDILGGWIYTFTFLYLLTYIGVIYLNLFWLFPKFLLKRRYLTYISLLSVAMMLALAIQMATEYVSYSCWPEFYERASYFSMPIVMDYISSFMLSTLCMIGGTMTVLLKEWKKCCVNALILEHFYTERTAKVHGKLATFVHLNNIIIIHIQIFLTKPCILNKLFHTFKSLWPDGIVQTFSLCIIRVTVGGAPLASVYRRQF